MSHAHQPNQIHNQGLLRFITAGSVDDGKSTLIGRLLFDSKNVFVDQLHAVSQSKHNRSYDQNNGSVDLALLTDGLRAEREQEKIGIDELERGVGGVEGVAEVGGPAHAAVLKRADEAEVGVFVEKCEGGEPRVLENGDERFARSG